MKLPSAPRTLVLALAVVLVAGIGVGAWLLVRDDESRTQTSCAAAAWSELSVEEEQDGLEVSYELQSSAPDEVWQVAVQRAGSTLVDSERRTDEDAELEVDLRVPTAGGSQFTATATSPDGETCSAELRHG